MPISQAISAHIHICAGFHGFDRNAAGERLCSCHAGSHRSGSGEFSKCADPKTAFIVCSSSLGTMPSMTTSIQLRSQRRSRCAAPSRSDHIASRIAFLLSSLEGFDTTEVAGALDCTEDEAAAHRCCWQGDRQPNSHRCLDHRGRAFIALDLQNLVEEQGHRVSNVARPIARRSTLSARTASLILADIQLADGSSGLEAVNQILESFSVPVIFITPILSVS